MEVAVADNFAIYQKYHRVPAVYHSVEYLFTKVNETKRKTVNEFGWTFKKILKSTENLFRAHVLQT